MFFAVVVMLWTTTPIMILLCRKKERIISRAKLDAMASLIKCFIESPKKAPINELYRCLIRPMCCTVRMFSPQVSCSSSLDQFLTSFNTERIRRKTVPGLYTMQKDREYLNFSASYARFWKSNCIFLHTERVFFSLSFLLSANSSKRNLDNLPAFKAVFVIMDDVFQNFCQMHVKCATWLGKKVWFHENGREGLLYVSHCAILKEGFQ